MPLVEHFAHPPGWGVYIYLYFFFGGIAGGAYALGTLLRWFGTTRDAVAARAAFYVAFPALLVCPLLLTIDLGQPLRFWHMLIDTNGGGFGIAFNWLSPMSVGAWALLLFGAFTFISFVEVLILDGRLTHPAGRILVAILRSSLGWLVNLIGSVLGLYICAYTGVLLSVSNQPIWSDAGWSLSALFVASSLSSGAAAMALANWYRRGSDGTTEKLHIADRYFMVLEVVLLAVFLLSLGGLANRILAGGMAPYFWVGVIALGILLPLALSIRRPWLRWVNPVAAVLVLAGALALRAVVVLAAQS